MPEKGFTATFISNTGKTLHRFNISGWKLYFARTLMALTVLLITAAAIIVAYGLLNAGETEELRNRISVLQDSLTARRNIEVRLETLEEEIQQLHEYRQRLENIAAGIPVQEDSLEQ
jgi:Tfp pilus assembly protein PilN